MNPTLQQLLNSHQRLRQELADLHQAVHHAGSMEDAAGTVEDARAFAARSVARHEADEEQSLFPRLRAAGMTDALESLEAAHRGQTAMWESVARARDLKALRTAVNALWDSYRDHMRVEEDEVFPAAARVLTEADWAAVGAEVNARRGRA